VRAAVYCSLTIVMGLSASPGMAGQTSGQFNVTVTLQSSNSPVVPKSAFCTKGPDRSTHGAVVTIVCSTGVVVDISAPESASVFSPIHGGAYRFNHLAEDQFPGLGLTGGINSYTGVGTTTAWRIVNLPEREYLEMLIGW
jgi:hypothetical protein